MYFLYKLPNLVAVLYLRSIETDKSALHVLLVLHSLPHQSSLPFCHSWNRQFGSGAASMLVFTKNIG